MECSDPAGLDGFFNFCFGLGVGGAIIIFADIGRGPRYRPVCEVFLESGPSICRRFGLEKSIKEGLRRVRRWQAHAF
jgi:hypothetical protein